MSEAIEEKHWFTNKQVIALLSFAISMTFEASYFYFDIKSLKQQHKADIEQLRTEQAASIELIKEDMLYEIKLTNDRIGTVESRLNKKIPLIYQNDERITELSYWVKGLK